MPKYKKTSSPAVNVTENANLAPAVNVTHLISRYGEKLANRIAVKVKKDHTKVKAVFKGICLCVFLSLTLQQIQLSVLTLMDPFKPNN